MRQGGRNFRILVADDSPLDRRLAEYALASHPYAVLMAKNGAEALELFNRYKPSLVITDWMMPDLSGPELCEKIRAAGPQIFTYIIFLTSMSDTESVVKGLAAGADDYLTKPFQAQELLARVAVGRRMVELHRQLEAKNRQLEELARTDPLTGLANRRAIVEWGARQLSGAGRHGFPVWVVMVDLDHFKNLNDRYGHDAGDTVLKRFAEILQEFTRASDLCGRMGGEEFLLVLSHVDRGSVFVTLDRLRQQLEDEKFMFAGEWVTVTASFGIAGFQGQKAPGFAHVVREADRALYAAKNAGRNCVKLEVIPALH